MLVAAVEEEGSYTCGGRFLAREGGKGEDVPPTTPPAIAPVLVELWLAVNPDERPVELVVMAVVPTVKVV